MRALLPLIVIAILAGCGHKGPLYLPKPKPDANKPSAQPAPSTQQMPRQKAE